MNYKEYLICQKRGHESNGIGLFIGMTQKDTCKYCGTTYYYKPSELVEERIPDKLDNDSSFTGLPV
jgi:hypothetical protein